MAGLLAEVSPAPAEEPSLSLPLPTPVPDLLPDAVEVELPALPSDSGFRFSGIPTDTSSNNASFTSTPPTTVADAASIASETSKPDIAATLPDLDRTSPLTDHFEDAVESFVEHVPQPRPKQQQTSQASSSKDTDATDATDATPTPQRARPARARNSAPVYNLAKLSGTDIHGKRRSKGDIVRGRRLSKRAVLANLVANDNAGAESSMDSVVQPGIDALGANWPLSDADTPQAARDEVKAKSTTGKKKGKARSGPAPAPRISTRSSGATAAAGAPASKEESLGKRGRKPPETTRIPRELRRLQDTAEFAGLESRPVLHTIWSNGKYIDPNDLDEHGEPINKRSKGHRAVSAAQSEVGAVEEAPKEETPPTVVTRQRRVKKWLDKGLYAGQPAVLDYTIGMSAAEKKKLAQLPELAPSAQVNEVLPLPMFAGLRLLINGRDFKLPFDVCNPLPPGQPKPDEWRKMTKNRFVGDAGTYWRKTDHFKDYQSKCVCKPEDGCAEDCQNRIMLYECDETNCNVGKEYCQNRAFQKLTARTKQGGRFRVGVEVVKTADRGYGVRSNRCFEPNQIIMEYTGEIITQAECERRMNEKYKDNECYYLMAFDQNMIIDATTGSIARFVNHSCSPNCRMEKWIVHGQPRMALFAGDRPIMTGDELTYDYNFDPFSAKNVQKCLCGSVNCRGVLGPKVTAVPKGEAQPKGAKGSGIKEAVKAATKAGKRKLKAMLDGGDETDGSNKKRKVINPKGVKQSLRAKAAAAVKKTANSISVKAKAALATAAAVAPRTTARSVSVRKAELKKASKTLTKNGKQLLLAASLTSGATTIVASPGSGSSNKPAKKTTPSAKGSVAKAGKGAIKTSTTVKRAPGKRTIKSTIKSAKHTIRKSSGRSGGKPVGKSPRKATRKPTGKKTASRTVRPRQIAKKSILEDIDGDDSDRALAAVAESISVDGPSKALKMSQTQNKIRVVTEYE
ncbi:hypothetical protein VPNG_07367 [Cytospora leucostoma]|uniref:Histone-lysine N-methyltransferase n=1 Tax=Cytospora leucostoma TaxID=1230097 RepID=A0A423WU63_9PEZI|nr:hypothetical protein VPNG_07367 [Cytospora leucostoma]